MAHLKKILISSFILLNILGMVRHQLPTDSKFINTLYRPVNAYLSFFSIYQDWMMFAPNPNRHNVYLTAEVEFLDGTKTTYLFPGQKGISQSERYAYGERFRKITVEGIRSDKKSFLWKDAAKFVLRKVRDENYSKIPAKVHLYRHWEVIRDMDKEFRPHGTFAKNYETFKFYSYEVI